MNLEAVAVVIASVVGSTGLASLITGGIQLSKASRIKKAVHDLSDLLKLQEPGTSEFDATKFALKVLTLDLIALRLVRVGARTWWKVFGLVVAVVASSISVADDWGRLAQLMEPASLRTLLLLAASYVLLGVGAFLYLISRRRERLVASVLEADSFTERHVILSSPPLQTLKWRRELKAARKRSALARSTPSAPRVTASSESPNAEEVAA